MSSKAAASDFRDNYDKFIIRPQGWTQSPYSSPAADKLLPSMEILWRDPTFFMALSRGHEYAQYDNIY